MDPREKQFRDTISELRVVIAAVDVVVFTFINEELHVFLIPIHQPPHYANMFGLPGGVIQKNESADEAVARHLKSKAQLDNVYGEQLYTFSDPDRDKRSRSISIAYLALLSSDDYEKQKASDGVWVSLSKLPTLAYDHVEIVETALERLQGRISYTNIIKYLLPTQFTLPELQRAYETILERDFDKRNFRKKFLSTGLIKELGKTRKNKHRPAQLYKFVNRNTITMPEVWTAA